MKDGKRVGDLIIVLEYRNVYTTTYTLNYHII